MWVGLSIMFGLFMLVVKSGVRVIPGKLQVVAELALGFIMDMVEEFIGKKEAPKYFPFIATIFFFVLACNLVGMIPGSYTITSQLVVTGVFASFIFVAICGKEKKDSDGEILLCFLCLENKFFETIFESFYKRRFNIKNSSKILPGHGGIFDRLDGFVMSSNALLVFSYFI